MKQSFAIIHSIILCLFLTSCATGFQDKSECIGFKELVGKKIECRKDLLIVYDWTHDEYYLFRPSTLFPTIEEYENQGKTYINFNDNTIVRGIMKTGSQITVLKAGLENKGVTMGYYPALFVKDSENKTYYLPSDYYMIDSKDSKDGIIGLNTDYLKIIE